MGIKVTGNTWTHYYSELLSIGKSTQQSIVPFTKEVFGTWVTLYTAGVITSSPGNLAEIYYGNHYTFKAG